MTILVTAASGHLGHLVVDALLARGVAAGDIVAGARTVAKAQDLADRGIRVVPLDYDDAASVAAALDGIDRVLLISSSDPGARVPQHRTVIDAARAAGVSQLVYTSVAHADTVDFVLAPDHKATEEAIAASGLPAVMLRNNWYIENHLGDAGTAAETGSFSAVAGDARIAAASRADYAAAAAVVLTEDGHLGQIYELSGDTAVSYDDMAVAFREALGREVAFAPIDAEQLSAGLTAAGLDAGTVQFVTAMQEGIARGVLADADPTLARLLGRPTTPFVDGIRAARAA